MQALPRFGFVLPALLAASLLALGCASTGLPYAIEEEYFNLATHAEGIEARAIRLHQAHGQGQLAAEDFATGRRLYQDARTSLDQAVNRLERAADSGQSPEASGMYLDAVRRAVDALAKFRGWSDGVVESPKGRGRGRSAGGDATAVDSQATDAPEARDPALASEIARHRASEEQRKAWMVAVLDSLRLRRFESLGPPPPGAPPLEAAPLEPDELDP